MFCDETRVKATRKPHRCAYCLSDIPVGSPATSEFAVFEGEAQGRYRCPACDDYVGGFWNYVDGECFCIPSDFSEYVQDCRLPHPVLTVEVECPSCGAVRVMRENWEHDGWDHCPKCSDVLEKGGADA